MILFPSHISSLAVSVRYKQKAEKDAPRYALYSFALLRHFICDVFDFRTFRASTLNAQKATANATQQEKLLTQSQCFCS